MFAIAGNHDYFSGISKVKDVILANNIIWIEKASYVLNFQGRNIQIDGNQPGKALGNADFAILCLHKPIDVAPYQEKYNLVFAGHLHGGQFVFWQNKKGLFPGRFFYRWNILKAKIGNCNYYVSKGMGDTLPVRYNCKKDIIFVKVS